MFSLTIIRNIDTRWRKCCKQHSVFSLFCCLRSMVSNRDKFCILDWWTRWPTTLYLCSMVQKSIFPIVQNCVLRTTTAWSSFTAKQVDSALDFIMLKRETTLTRMLSRFLPECYTLKEVNCNLGAWYLNTIIWKFLS